MDKLGTKIPDLVMAVENLKAIDYLSKRGMIQPEQAKEARNLQVLTALLYLSVQTQQVQMVQHEFAKGMAEINAKAEAAKKSFMVSAKGDEKPSEENPIRQ